MGKYPKKPQASFGKRWILHWVENHEKEIHSISMTFFPMLAIEGAAQLTALYNGDFSEAVIMAFLAAVGRSLFKTVWIVKFPKLMPTKKMTKNH